MTAVLDGIRVIELGEIMQGPLAAQTLGDLGADVIKVERGPHGDGMRRLDREAVAEHCMASYFAAVNRHKRSVTLDLKTDGGMELLHRLLGSADVLLHNYRPAAIIRLGLDYDSLKQRYPRLIHAGASGFGDAGPWAHKAGQDMLAQTVSGLARAVGDADVDSYIAPTAAVDYASGMGLAQGVLAALLNRERTGRGSRVSVNLLDTAVAMQMLEAASESMYGRELNWVTQWYSGTFRTRDGVVTVLGLFRDNALALVCGALGIDDLSRREDLSTTELQACNKATANALLAPTIAELTTEEAMAKFDGVDLLCAPQMSLRETLDHPQVAANELMVDVDVAGQDPARLVGYPVHLSEGTTAPREVPALGQHTDEVLTELGLHEADLERLAGEGSIQRSSQVRERRWAQMHV